jgi:hypothetical protein
MYEMIKTLGIDKGKGTTLTREVSRIIHGNIFGSACEPEKDSSNNQNTCFAVTRSWFSKVSNPIVPIFNMNLSKHGEE